MLLPMGDRPRLLLAIMPSGGQFLLDATFLGAFSDEDMTEVTEAANVFSTLKGKEVGRKELEVLLDSTNPWVAYQAILRFEKDGLLSSRDFARLVSRVRSNNVRRQFS